MSDNTVFAEIRDICNDYPNFVSSDGTIEWNSLNFSQNRICCNNMNSYLAQIYTDMQNYLKEIRDLLVEIRDNTNRIP